MLERRGASRCAGGRPQLVRSGRVADRHSDARTWAKAGGRVVDAAYEKRPVALTSNIHPAGFDELMPKTLATATVDRLLHHAHVLLTDGTDSYRLAQATAGKGVTPLA
jgi:hypothetical protein